ncbi:MAG: type III pantothenate kinase [Phycisphaeraceae bacterium]|nr:type III pantothenate kinase [Phycisphaeraceae bacterium]
MTPLLAVSVGNTRTAFGAFADGTLLESDRVDNSDHERLDATARRLWQRVEEGRGDAVTVDRLCVLASVNDPVADPLEVRLSAALGTEIQRIGRDLAVPIGECLEPGTRVGADRLLNAAAAWDVMRSACIVVDAGTAVTVDFIDGEGVFHGGAIAPGASMQLTALHERTAALPRVAFAQPDDVPFGRNTAEAMLQGVYHGLRGMVWRLVERYATGYGAFPPVVATGGDAATLFGEDELIDRIVPELTLLGIAVAVRRSLEVES